MLKWIAWQPSASRRLAWKFRSVHPYVSIWYAMQSFSILFFLRLLFFWFLHNVRLIGLPALEMFGKLTKCNAYAMWHAKALLRAYPWVCVCMCACVMCIVNFAALKLIITGWHTRLTRQHRHHRQRHQNEAYDTLNDL